MSGHPRAIVPVGHVEPVPRRVRAMLGGRVVLDTTRAVYLWERVFYPQFLVPVGDVDPAVLVDGGEARVLRHGHATSVGLRSGSVTRPGAGALFTESPIAGLAGMVRWDWDALDAWFEEDEQVFVHPRSPYVRVDALRSSRTVRVELDGMRLAESSATVMVFETGLPTRHYFDRGAVDWRLLRPSATVTACPYKGRTTGYWSVQAPAALHADLAWSYDFPTRELLPIAGMIAFYDERVDVFLNGQLQPPPTMHLFDAA